jgi:hypothetical protein
MRDRLAADCGAATPSLSGQRTNGLTPRERDVCVLAAHGSGQRGWKRQPDGIRGSGISPVRICCSISVSGTTESRARV